MSVCDSETDVSISRKGYTISFACIRNVRLHHTQKRVECLHAAAILTPEPQQTTNDSPAPVAVFPVGRPSLLKSPVTPHHRPAAACKIPPADDIYALQRYIIESGRFSRLWPSLVLAYPPPLSLNKPSSFLGSTLACAAASNPSAPSAAISCGWEVGRRFGALRPGLRQWIPYVVPCNACSSLAWSFITQVLAATWRNGRKRLVMFPSCS